MIGFNLSDGELQMILVFAVDHLVKKLVLQFDRIGESSGVHPFRDLSVISPLAPFLKIFFAMCP
jgi:hypothetical protein